eukprot:NODE_86_length_22075_cov_1.190253.p4 type:complete len:479 gc:universal NODE_86_length_22075_cov_1.190253:1893-3329(+)
MNSNELSRLGSKDFDPQAFIRRQIATLDDSGLQDLKSKLKEAHKQAQQDVNHVLMNNYKSFLNLTEQLTAIEVEQLSISNIILEVKGIFKAMQLEEIQVEAPQGGTELQEEIVDLEEAVGKIDKKVLHISYYCYHLTGSYPDKKIYRIFLFTDNVVITVRKKKGQNARTKEFVDAFIPLNKLFISSASDIEITLLHTENQTELKFRFEKVKNKQDTYENIKQAVSVISQGAKSHLRSNTTNSMTMMRPAVETTNLETEIMTSTQFSAFTTVIDQLDDAVHMRNFQQSAKLYNEGKKILSNYGYKDSMAHNCRKLLQLKHKELSNILLSQLNNQTNSKQHVITYNTLLMEIGLAEQAAEIFLKMRSQLIKKRARQIVYQGDVVNFISDLSFVLFSLIRNTGDWYLTSFKDAMMISIYVKWARDEVSNYVEICKRHLNINQFSSLRKIAQTLYQIEHHADIVIFTNLVEQKWYQYHIYYP